MVQLPNSNPVFAGETPLKYMVKGGLPALMRVRQLLDARRGGEIVASARFTTAARRYSPPDSIQKYGRECLESADKRP